MMMMMLMMIGMKLLMMSMVLMYGLVVIVVVVVVVDRVVGVENASASVGSSHSIRGVDNTPPIHRNTNSPWGSNSSCMCGIIRFPF
jgi:hypothetical protein